MLLSAAHPVAAAVPPRQRSQLHPLGTSAFHSPVHHSSRSLQLREHQLQHIQKQHTATCRALLDPSAVAHMSDHDHAEVAGWPSLLLTCMLMFLGAYGCGMLPGWLPNQQRLTSSVSAVGAGLLLGSALCIILPEGFEAAMEAEHHPPGWATSATLLCGFWLMLLLDSLSHWLPGAHSHGSSSISSRSHLPHRSLSDADDSTVLNTSDLAQGRGLQGHAEQGIGNTSSEEHTVLLMDFAAQQDPSSSAAAAEAGDAAIGGAGALHTQHTTSRRPCASPTKSRAGSKSTQPGTGPSTSVGGAPSAAAAAAAGAAGTGMSPSREVSGGGSIGSVRRLATGSGSFSSQAAAAAGGGGGGNVGSGSGATAAAAAAAAADGSGGPAAFDSISRVPGAGSKVHVAMGTGGAKGVANATAGEWWRPWVVDPTHHALLGLLVHSVSDGLAVGAASLSTVPEISLGVATAMVVHKGPVAIGLATFLRSALWSPTEVHRGVLMFAAASPLAAVLTYGLLSAIPGITDNIPLVVLFSGGTVLYAATMHILPGAMQHSNSSSSSKGQQHQHGGSLDRSHLMLVSLGMLLPLILGSAFGGHHHHHH